MTNSTSYNWGPYSLDTGQRVDGSPGLLTKLASLFGDRELSDIQLVVSGQVYYAHKLVLSCSSDVFRVMLTQPAWSDSQRTQIVLTEEHSCTDVFRPFMSYLYSGCIHLDHSAVLPVLMLADKYNVCDLRDICIEYMTQHIVTTVEYCHAVSWHQYARLCGHRTLATTCYNYIKWNFEQVALSDDFLSMEFELLLDFLRDTDLVVSHEYVVYEAMQRWLVNNDGAIQRQLYNESDKATTTHEARQEVYKSDTLLPLVSSIRFPMMQQAKLKLLGDNALAAQYKDIFSDRLGIAMLYHSYQTEQHKEIIDKMHPSLITPRNYIDDTWSTNLVIDKYPKFANHEVRPLIFSSPISGSAADENRCWEWNIDFYPKGVQFERCVMIGLWRNIEVSGVTYSTVRLVISSKTPERRHVDVTIIVTGVQDHLEYHKNVIHRRCCFDKRNRMYNLDDIVPYHELNSEERSSCLSGKCRDEFKVTIVVKPL